MKKILQDVFSRVIAGIILAILALIWAAVHFNWRKEALTFLGATSPVPHWLLAVLMVACLMFTLVEIQRLWKGFKRPRPRWFTWNELDWQLLGDFFAEGCKLKPELAGNLYVYIRGPFCRNPACKREIPVVALAASSVFAHSLVVCPCARTAIIIDFKREIVGISEERAVLVEACKEAQAASRRGEHFRLLNEDPAQSYGQRQFEPDICKMVAPYSRPFSVDAESYPFRDAARSGGGRGSRQSGAR